MRHNMVLVEDSPYDDVTMRITSHNSAMVTFLQNEGTIISIDTWNPSNSDSEYHPHIVIASYLNILISVSYNWIIFKEDVRLGEFYMGILLGVSHDVGSLMSFLGIINVRCTSINNFGSKTNFVGTKIQKY